MPSNNWSQKRRFSEEIGNINKHSFRKQDVTTPFGSHEFQKFLCE